MNIEELIDQETKRMFCFFQIGFHEDKFSCIKCPWWAICKKDAAKMRKIFGKLSWESQKLGFGYESKYSCPIKPKGKCPTC